MHARRVIQRVDAPKSHDRPSWHRVSSKDSRSVVMVCGLCGRSIDITDYTVSNGGYVNPAILCTQPFCGWICSAQLDGWIPETS